MASDGKSHPTGKRGRRSPKRDVWTQPLWPLHLKPLPDELLSCWLVRLAHAHGMKVQTFAQQLLGHRRQVWNRDIDRLCPRWLIEPLCRNTATPLATAVNTTVRAYEGVLYRKYRESGIVPWILPLQMYHRKRRGFGLQYCPVCLANDAEPYFRKRWRVALYTFCPSHGCLMMDRCVICDQAVMFHRRELGRPNETEAGAITLCHHCSHDLRDTPPVPARFYEESSRKAFLRGVAWLDSTPTDAAFDLAEFNVLHQFLLLFLSGYRGTDLMGFAEESLDVSTDAIATDGRACFETRSVAERHHMLQLGFWYMADLPGHLTAAWRAAAITYSALLRDMTDCPPAYLRLISRFSNWRLR